MEGKLFECDSCKHFAPERVCWRRKQDLSCYEEQPQTASTIFVNYINQHIRHKNLNIDALSTVANNYGLYVANATKKGIEPLDFESWCKEMNEICKEFKNRK